MVDDNLHVYCRPHKMPSESDKWGWKHVSVFGGFNKGSGTKRWKCNHCNLRYNGSYSRVRAHLLGFTGVGVKSCPAIDRSLREAFQILEEERLARRKKRTCGSGKPSKCIQTSQSNLTRGEKTITKERVDYIVARFFYADGLNISAVNSPYFHEMTKAIAAFGPDYEPPTLDVLDDSFLSKEKARIEKSMALIKESWPHTACTILCVSRLDNVGCLCINVFISSPRGLMFLKEVDISENNGDKNAFIGVLCDSIGEVGPLNVLQILSYLGTSTESFESLVLSKFPHIFWSPCTLHSVRMLMEDISEMDWMKPIFLCAKRIDQRILTTQHSSPFVLTQNLKKCSNPLVPSYCIVQKIYELKQALQDLVVSEVWKRWKMTNEDDIKIEAAILGEEFWAKAHLLLQLLEPFVELLAALDIDKSVMGDVYIWRFQALEVLRSKGIDDSALCNLEALIESRWDMFFSPLHAAGYILNPRYYGRGQTKDKTVMRGWKATLDRYECDSACRQVLREQLSSYCRLEGSLGDEDAVECRNKMDPVAWWENFGFETPHLQTLAIKILSQVSTVAMCQETWIHDDFPSQESVDKLEVLKKEDLVFVRNNLKLQSLRNGNLNFLSSGRNGSLSSLSCN